ncbi:hypothetical protein [Streptosporangium roseum]|uniref:hypothetical protein n=1 Tax=Streptosporangium roseum TaxID=2001 RepID=UPI00332E9FB6
MTSASTSTTASTTASGHAAGAGTSHVLTVTVLTATYAGKGGLSLGADLIPRPRRKQAECCTGSSGVRVFKPLAAGRQ